MGSSSGEDRSLGTGGVSLPQWMKGRGDTRYDFDQSSFSPPSHDDNFFCIRYSAAKSSLTAETTRNNSARTADSCQEVYRPISQVLSENKNSSGSTVVQANVSSSGESKDLQKKNIDFSKYPLPCQPFVPAAAGKNEGKSVATSKLDSGKFKVAKSQGTDDGFHSGAALCGKSIVHVANRIMSRQIVKIESANETTETMEQKQRYNEERLLRKAESKSLPVTPIASPISTPDTSPKSRRRINNANRYFTGAFAPDRDGNNKYQAGWLLSSILGQTRQVETGNKIQEVDEEGESSSPALELLPSRFLNRKKSISSQDLSYLGRNEEERQQHDVTKKDTAVYKNVFRAKPSELREMNFWSPTSM